MASTLQIKRSSVQGKKPLEADLQVGELAVNLTDGLLYSKNTAGNVIVVGSSTTSNVTEGVNLYFTNARATTAVTQTTLSNLTVSGNITTSGNVSAQYIFGDATYMTGIAPTLQLYRFANIVSDANVSYYQSVDLAQYSSNTLGTVTKTVSQTSTLLAEFLTNVGFPNLAKIPVGAIKATWETQKASGVLGYVSYFEVWKRTSGGVETLIATSETTSTSTLNSSIRQQATATLSSEESLNLTDRILLKFYAYVLSVGTASITIRFDGSSNSGFELPALPASIVNFVPYLNATNNLDLGNYYVKANYFQGNVFGQANSATVANSANSVTAANVQGLTTANVTEVTNLYFTNNRAVSALTSGSGISIASNGRITATVSGGLSTWSTKTANYTAVNGDRILANTISGSFNITLPASPTIGDEVYIADAYDFSTFSANVSRNGKLIEGSAEDLELDLKGVQVQLVYAGGNNWEIYYTSTVQTDNWIPLTSNTNALVRQRFVANTIGGEIYITLPSSPDTGDYVVVADGWDFTQTSAFVVRNGNLIRGAAEDLEIDVRGVSVELVWDGYSWQVYYTSATGEITTDLARKAISVVGAGSYDNTTGVITITGGVTSVAGATGAVSNAQILSGLQQTGYLTTANITEVSNLYYTVSRANSAIDNRVTKAFIDNLNVDADTLDGQDGTYFLDWTNTTNKPDPVVTVTLTGDVTGSASGTLIDLASNTVSIATTIAANSVELGTDTTGPYVGNLIAGTGVTITGLGNENTTPTISIGQAVATNSDVTFKDLTVTGNVFITGSTFFANANVLLVEDPLIQLAYGNPGDAFDIGIVGHYVDSGTQRHAGLFRDATDKEFKFFANTTVEPTGNIIDTSGDGFEFANVRAKSFLGEASALSNVNASSITLGTLPAARLPTSGVSAATYGNSTFIPSIVVDSTGRITSASNVILTTANVAEVNNLYFSNARVAAAISTQTLLNATFSSNVTANYFVGDGSLLTGISSAVGYLNSSLSAFPSGDYGDLTAIRDAFGVATNPVYDCMDPLGSLSTEDLSVLT